MVSFGGSRLLSKEKHGAHFNVVLLYRIIYKLHNDPAYDFNHLFLLCKDERVCIETRQDLSLTI